MRLTVFSLTLARLSCFLCAAWLVPTLALADDFFGDEQKQTIAAAFEHVQDELRVSGISGVQEEVKDCYDTAYKKALREALFYCIAFDTDARITDAAHWQTMHRM